MSSINSIGSNSNMSSMMQGMQGRRRPDAAEMAENLFSKLDTSSQGYLEKADLQAAFDKISTTSDSSSGTSATSSADSLFAQLDTDSDGKVTKTEFSDTLKKLSEQLDEQFMSMRMQGAMSESGMGGMGGMAPPPPPGDDAGFTQEELSSQLEEIGDTDTQRSSLISSVIENFEAADTDSDGKVSFREAMAFEESSSASTTAASTDSTAATATAASSTDSSALDAKVMLQIMRLMDAYGLAGESRGTTNNALSVTA